MAKGSLVFGATTATRATGSTTATASLDPFTYILWCFPTTLTAQRKLVSRSDASTSYKHFRLGASAGAIELFVRRVASSQYTSFTDMLVLNTWCCVAVTFNSGAAAGSLMHIYGGTLSTPMVETASYTKVEGSGALTADNGVGSGIAWGNSLFTSPTEAFQGRESMGAIFAAELSLTDLESWRKCARVTIGSNVAKEFKRFGKDGADAIDYTGNGNGTVTGATQGDGPPVGGWWTRTNGLYRRAA